MPTHSESADLKRLRKNVSLLEDKEWPATRSVVDAFTALAEIAGKPLFIVVDEFGKTWSIRRIMRNGVTFFALQALAEFQGRFFVGLSSSSFQLLFGSIKPGSTRGMVENSRPV